MIVCADFVRALKRALMSLARLKPCPDTNVPKASPNSCHFERRRSFAKRMIFAVEEPAFCMRRDETRWDGAESCMVATGGDSSE